MFFFKKKNALDMSMSRDVISGGKNKMKSDMFIIFKKTRNLFRN
jgi:hypothetical protein